MPASERINVVVDTREQRPWDFGQFDDVDTRRLALPFGDYALAYDRGDPMIVIERKSLSDLLGTLTRGRSRFFREMEKTMRAARAWIIIDDASWPDLWSRDLGGYSASAVLGSLSAISIRYRVSTIFAGTRGAAAHIARSLFLHAKRAMDSDGPV